MGIIAIRESLYRVNLGLQLESDLLKSALLELLDSDVRGRDSMLGGLLHGLMARGPNIDEVCCLIDTILSIDKPSIYNIQAAIPKGERLVSAVGSGKKGLKTFNISTPALLVASSAGAYSFKPVSSSTSSRSGSADFLTIAGSNLNLSEDDLISTLSRVKFGALRIENSLPRFDAMYGGKFHTPHILSFGLPVLATSIRPDGILFGLAHPDASLAAQVLQRYRFKDAMVVSSTPDGIHFMDEFVPFGQNYVCTIKNGILTKNIGFRPSMELSLPNYTADDISESETAEDNVATGIRALAGKGTSAQIDTICLNAGNILYLAGKAESYIEGFYIAKTHVETGKSIDKLREFIEATGGHFKFIEKALRCA